MTATVSNPPVRRRRGGPHAIEWPVLPDNFVLPDDPVENEVQPLLAAALTDALCVASAIAESALLVSNFALCASVDGRIICKAPDWMYVPAVKSTKGIRRSYTPHTEGVIPPVVMEFLSESDCGEYSVQSGRKLGKWYFYEQIVEVPTYVVFDPASGDLDVRVLQNGIYEEAASTEGRYFLADLNLWLGVWQGTRHNYTGYWLRWWTPDGEMLLWSEELAKEAEANAKEAEANAKEAEANAKEAESRAQKLEAENARLLARLKEAGLD